MTNAYYDYIQTKDKKSFMVGVFLRYPHAHGTGFDSEIISDYRLMFAESAEEMIALAKETIVPPNVDPALISVVVEEVEVERK